jgi:hypothetical protein
MKALSRSSELCINDASLEADESVQFTGFASTSIVMYYGEGTIMFSCFSSFAVVRCHTLLSGLECLIFSVSSFLSVVQLLIF